MKFLLAVVMLCFSALAASAQTTVFTYQGHFTDSTAAQPTNGTYEMQFKLFTTAQVNTGMQIGQTQTVPNVSVVNGIFTVQLDGENSFRSGARIFIEIGVRPLNSSAAFTTLAPRQEVTSAPYAIQSSNALTADLAVDSNKLGGIDANQYVTGQVVRSINNLTNNVTLAAGNNITITPSGNTLTIASTGGSGNFIVNSTVQQPNAFFNISGGGTLGGTLSANLVNSVTNYRIGGSIVLATPNATSVVVGPLSNYTLSAGNNVFFGYKAGAAADNTGQGNVFVGSEAGTTNSNGAGNSFVGRDAGFFNSSGGANSFFGNSAGKQNTTASFNSFFGTGSGISNTIGERNSFFGFQSGQLSKTANDNSFFGYQAGKATTNGGNTFFGSSAGISNTTGIENTFVGNGAGSNNSTGSKNTVIGSGSFLAGSNNTAVGNDTTTIGSNNTLIGFNAIINGGATHSTVIGDGAFTNKSNTIVLGTNTDTVEAPNLLTAKNITATSKVDAFTVDAGLGIFDAIKLNNTPFGDKPLCYKTTTKEIGVCPASLSSRSEQSENLLVNAANEQNAQIEKQAEQIKAQQRQIEELKQIVCAMNPAAKICAK